MRVSTRARAPISAAGVRRLAEAVLRAERRRQAIVSFAFVGPTAMRTLNRTHLRRDHATDVIAFSLAPGPRPPNPVVGDVYICPAVAAQNARAAGVTAAEEMKRLVVHGVLHVLGYDHPAGEQRTSSPMWRRQERYLRRFAS